VTIIYVHKLKDQINILKSL